MLIKVFKGFDKDFCTTIKIKPLIDCEIDKKINVIHYDRKLKKQLCAALLGMDEDETRWITYQEFSFIKSQIELAVKEDGLQLQIVINNTLPDYYPLDFPVSDNLAEEISNNLENNLDNTLTIECENFLSIYNSLHQINGIYFSSFYNYEYEKNFTVDIINYYPSNLPVLTTTNSNNVLSIIDDIETYLNNFSKLINSKPKSITFRNIGNIVAQRAIASLKAYCLLHKIQLFCYEDSLISNNITINDLYSIAKEIIKIPNFKDFRKLRFYKNPDIDNQIIEISQANIITDIINQAEISYNDGIYRDIFITASTGAGKSIMFQIPAIYLAKKHRKLTVIIEPVKALMQDQKEKLNSNGYTRVEVFNSDLISQIEKEKVINKIKSGEVDLLYLSPETLLSYSIETLIGNREIGLMIIDEAHIVTTWGFGFRPDYWYLGSYINKIRNGVNYHGFKGKKLQHFPICAFTATAINGGIDDSVCETILSLYMENPIKYIGYAKRENIGFDINIIEKQKSANNLYEERKAKTLAERIQTYLVNKEKSIVYFPYAVYAHDAYNGFKSFSNDKQLFTDKRIGLYTGTNKGSEGIEEFNQNKKNTFEKFRNGDISVVFATKAFGMGVDINDIKNVYHYAISGNLCDYVQEIGRAARNKDLHGTSQMDYYYNDIHFIQSLFGMSQIKAYQISQVLSEIYDTYKSKGGTRNLLISPDTFTYIFGKTNDPKSKDSCVNKLKTCLLMLEKDLYEKFNFKVMLSRPQSVFTKAFIVIDNKKKDHVLASKYGKHFKKISNSRDRSNDISGACKISDIGDIYSVNLKSVWEDNYPNMSFPQFKYHYFKAKEKYEKKTDIMPEIIDDIYTRQKVTIEAKNGLLCDLKPNLYNQLTKIGNTLYSNFKGRHFTSEEMTNILCKEYGLSRATIISNSLFDIVDPLHTCIKIRRNDESNETSYYISNGTFTSVMIKIVTKSTLLRNLSHNTNSCFSEYMVLNHNTNSETVLKLLSLFDLITYEIIGGEEPEIFVRLNDPEKIRRIVSGELFYSNNYVVKAKQKHNRDIMVLEKFITELNSDKERWDYIENYFLGEDVLNSKSNFVEEQIVSLNYAIDKDKSYPLVGTETWLEIGNLLGVQYTKLINEFMTNSISLPNYILPYIKSISFSCELLMAWVDKNILLFNDTLTSEDVALATSKGWKTFSISCLDMNEIKNALSVQ